MFALLFLFSLVYFWNWMSVSPSMYIYFSYWCRQIEVALLFIKSVSDWRYYSVTATCCLREIEFEVKCVPMNKYVVAFFKKCRFLEFMLAPSYFIVLFWVFRNNDQISRKGYAIIQGWIVVVRFIEKRYIFFAAFNYWSIWL